MSTTTCVCLLGRTRISCWPCITRLCGRNARWAMTIKVKHKVGGYYKVRSSGGVVAFLEGAAESVAARANAQLKGKGGKGFVASSRQGAKRPQGRWRTSVAAV